MQIFKEAAAQDIEKRFNVSEAIKEQNVAIFAIIIRFSLSATEAYGSPTKKSCSYSMVKEKLALLISAKECHIIKEATL